MALPNYFRPKAGNFGAQFVSTSLALGTGGREVTASTTSSSMVPKPPCTTCQLVGLVINAYVAAVSSGGTVTLQAFRRNNVGTPADVTLTATKSIEADVITVADQSYPFALTATSVQNLTFQSTDTLRINAVSDAAIGTAPQLTVTALWAIVQP